MTTAARFSAASCSAVSSWRSHFEGAALSAYPGSDWHVGCKVSSRVSRTWVDHGHLDTAVDIEESLNGWEFPSMHMAAFQVLQNSSMHYASCSARSL